MVQPAAKIVAVAKRSPIASSSPPTAVTRASLSDPGIVRSARRQAFNAGASRCCFRESKFLSTRGGIILDEDAAIPLSFAKELQNAGYALSKNTVNAYSAGALVLAGNNGDPTAPIPIQRLNDRETANPLDRTGARRSLSASEMLQRYRAGTFDEPCDVADLLALADLLPENDPVFAV